ncbi:MAG TPA: transcription termination/antitermination NusG family protein, partial [Mycobacteriales bacterium]|nr:transcription termination/antitermination NusG family protein [Mycobacteriales bacterium]
MTEFQAEQSQSTEPLTEQAEAVEETPLEDAAGPAAQAPAFESAAVDESADSAEPVAEAAEPVEELADEDADPVEAFTNRLRSLPGDWYVVHTYAGYENKVKANLETRIASLNMEDFIFQIEVPTQDEMVIKQGKRQTVQSKIFPGYV